MTIDRIANSIRIKDRRSHDAGAYFTVLKKGDCACAYDCDYACAYDCECACDCA